MLEHRQKKLDLRKPKGLDKIVKKGLPSWYDSNFVDTD